MKLLTIPAACPRVIDALWLLACFSLISGCGSSSQPAVVPAMDAALQADDMSLDYAIHSPEFVRGNEYEPGHVTLEIDHGDNDRQDTIAKGGFMLFADVPSGVNITAAALVSEGRGFFGRNFRRSDDCELTDTIVCHREGGSVARVSLELSYKIFVPGEHEFTATLVSAGQDPDTADNVRSMIFRYVASTRYLQTLLDTTKPGGSVTLPSGTYMGTLHGGDRQLHVRGADDGTILLSDNPDMPLLQNAGDGSVFSHLELRTSGAPVLVRSGYNITLRDSLIAPIQGQRHDLQQLFVNNSYRLLYSRVEGWGGDNGYCRNLLYTGPQYVNAGSLPGKSTGHASTPDSHGYAGTVPYGSGKTPSRIYIQNTLFRDNTCSNLLQDNLAKHYPFMEHDSADPDLFIANNTFVNNKGGMHFSGNRHSNIQISNNIFVTHQQQLSLPDAQNQSDEHRVYLAGNLVWDSLFESLVDSVAAAGPGVSVGAADLYADPLFVDAANDDYSLATGSPAIDAGVAVEPYLWTEPTGGVSAVQPSAGQDPVPLDGLLNGIDRLDIGAFEYIP